MMIKSFRIAICIAVVLSIMTLTACGNGVETNENVKLDLITDAIVYYYTVCPDCKHINADVRMAELTAGTGESIEGNVFCDSCGHKYYVKIKRN